VRDKLIDLQCTVDRYYADFVFITESWLDGDISSGIVISNSDFIVLRHDRSNGKGGGVCAIFKKKYKFVEIPTNKNLELLAFDVFIGSFTYRFIVVYRPPFYDNLAWDYFLTLLQAIGELCKGVNRNISVVGDFNFPNICWENLTATGPHLKFHQTFLDFIIQCGLVQCVGEATRANNVLDLVFVNDPVLVNVCSVGPPWLNSDHQSVEFSLNLPIDLDKSEHAECCYVYDFDKANYDSINNYLNTYDWQVVLSGFDDVNSCLQAFMDILHAGFDYFVPIRIVHKSKKGGKPGRHFPHYIRQLFNKKTAAWRLYKRFRSLNVEKFKNRYVLACEKYSEAVEAFVIKRENKLIGKNNTGAFYKYVNHKLVCRSGIPTLKDHDNNLIADDKDKAKLLNDHYSSVFTRDNGVLPDFSNQVPTGVRLEDIVFSQSTIYKHLNKLKTNSSSGPDELPAFALKNLAYSLSSPLAILYSLSFRVSKVPDLWKKAIITPVFKKGQSSDVVNYRPISLTCIVCKVMETVIKDVITTFLLRNKLISKQQHGFVKRHSTCSQLLECVNDWSLAINGRLPVDVIYIDFNKAFDTVVHTKLLSKLEANGVSGKVKAWIADFLSERFQAVKVGEHISDFSSVLSGVPQGSVLGPLLFLIYINDLVAKIGDGASSKLFADDVKIYSVVKCPVDFNNLQHCLDLICEWAVDWQLSISIRKCSVLHIGRSNKGLTYVLNGEPLVATVEARDLGVTIDNALRFASHCNDIASRAHRRAMLILRCFESRDPHLLFKAFTVYVRPMVEYCSAVWSPSYKCDIALIETVQRRFTKRLYGFNALSYAERLARLNAETLELRRLKFDLATIYKITHDLIAISSDTFFELRKDSKTRGHGFWLCKPIYNNNARAFSFACRNIDCWNNLKASIVNSDTLSLFKSRLEFADLSKHLTIS